VGDSVTSAADHANTVQALGEELLEILGPKYPGSTRELSYTERVHNRKVWLARHLVAQAEGNTRAYYVLRAEAAERQATDMEKALERVRENAKAWHGSEGLDTGHARALAVIAEWCDAALSAREEAQT
jgi:hypothetical protein